MQVQHLPPSFMCICVAKHVGKMVEAFIESDSNNYNSQWRRFMRAQALEDVNYSLRKISKMHLEIGAWKEVALK